MKRTRFNQFMRDHFRQVKVSLALAGLSTIGLAVTQLLVPWPLKIIFDHILLDKQLPESLSFLSRMLEGGKDLALIWVCLGIVSIAVLKGLFSYSQLYITSRIGSQAVYSLRKELFAHLQRLSLSFHTRARSGELMTKVSSDTHTLRNVFARTVLDFVTESLTLIGMFVIMCALNWKLTLIAVATFPFLCSAVFHLYRKTKASSRRRRKREGEINTQMSEVLTAMPLVRAFGREKHEEKRFETKSAETLQESIRQARLEAAALRTMDIITATGTAATLLFGSLHVLDGSMLPGELLLFISYLNNIYKPIRGLAKLSADISKVSVSAERIAEILEIEPEIKDSPHAIEAINLKGEIVFENVSFNYGDGKAVLYNVSFIVTPGQRVALVGASGVGKSTIVSLLLRFYDPQQGAILLDSVNLKDYKRESVRREIGLVLQDSILFGATIKENITYGKLDATMDEIVAAAKAANAHEFISQLEDGYDTVIGERGCTLSGGQRQRLSIARAIIRNARILILDELTTGLDAENERAVLEALERLAAGCTTFFISHNLRLASRADLVLYLEDGRIIERGAHTELMRINGRYAALYNLHPLGRDDTAPDGSPALTH